MEKEINNQEGVPSREEVVLAYKALHDEGKDYFETEDNPTGVNAKKLYDKWFASQQAIDTSNDPLAQAKSIIDIGTVFIDAGYTDEDELNNIIDSLSQELEHAQESKNAEAIELLETKIKELESKLPQ